MKARSLKYLAFMGAVLVLVNKGFAYKEKSHQEMSLLASEPTLSVNNKIRILGALGEKDPSGIKLYPASNGALFSPLYAIGFGAMNEDYDKEEFNNVEVGSRPLQHFYNPQKTTCNFTGSCGGLLGVFTASKDWIFEHENRFGFTDFLGVPLDRQFFSYLDARHYQRCVAIPEEETNGVRYPLEGQARSLQFPH